MSKALENALASLEKKYGKGSVINFQDSVEEVDFISSGSIAFDMALGGGYPVGRIVEIWGEESSGKSTAAIHACIEAQKLGKMCLYIDMENAFDRDYAHNIGLDFDKNKLLFSQPTTGEECFDIAETYIDTNEIGVIVIDSVAAMVPQAELDGEFGDAKMGLHARLMSQGMRKLIGKIKRSNTLLFFINQTRDKIGGMGYGDPKVTTGGNALKFYATQRIKISRTGSNKDGDVAISNNVKVEVKKNKIAPPFKKAEFVIVFGEGICKYLEVIDLATDLKIIQKSGSWYSYGDTKLGQGADAVKEILKDNPELFDELELLVRKKLKS